MNLLSLFTREEPIAGLAIDDSFVRLSLLAFNKDRSAANVQILSEEPLLPGTIINGTIQKEAEFTQALQKLLKKINAKIRYAVVSLPANASYTHLFKFPKSVRGEKLEQTMKLTVGFQLPMKPEEVYLDWEKVEGSEDNEIFLAAMPRSVINAYATAANKVGLKIVAVELQPLSIARAMDPEGAETFLLKILGGKSAGIFIIKKLALRFARILPENLLSEQLLSAEVRKIRDFYEAEHGPIDREIELNEARIVPAFGQHPQMAKGGAKWIAGVGASMRGLLPRSQDTLISLMPVGTEEAYEYQKAITFAEFISHATIGFSIFFSAAFIAVWILMTSLQQRTLNQIETLSSLPLPTDAIALETRAQELNAFLSGAYEIIKTTPRFSVVLEELRKNIGGDIMVSGLSLPSPEGVFALTGIATDRGQLNAFRRALDESSFFSDVQLPLTNLELKEKIPFSVTFRLQNPQALFE